MIGGAVGLFMAFLMLTLFIVTGDPTSLASMVFCLACAGFCVAIDR